jgi:uncharacterized membrane protein (UPF0127 family)
MIAAAIVALIALAGIVFLGARLANDDDNRVSTFTLAPTMRAEAPFDEFDEAMVAVDDDCNRLLIARTTEQRGQGLREVTSLEPYDGMLFVFPADTDARFTMSNTPLPLDITFLDANGVPVDTKTMQPCLDGSDADCPVYASKGKYRYALERPAGAGGGAISSCSA